MKKLILQGIIIVGILYAGWYALSRTNWVKLFGLEEIQASTETKLGEMLWEMTAETSRVVENEYLSFALDSMISKICSANGFDRNSIKVHVVDKAEINAFAMPDGHLVVHTGLIQSVNNPEELAGVLAHEMAHIQQKHVLKKLIKELGIAYLTSGTLEGLGSETVREAAKVLSSTAFDRGMEKEADLHAVDYLKAAGINPRPLADFMEVLSEQEGDAAKYLSWVSTHAASKERAAYILEYIGSDESSNYSPVLSENTWKQVLESL